MDATWVVAWNGDVCSRNTLARAPKRYSCIGLDWYLLCGGSKCAALSAWPLAWQPNLGFNRIHCNHIRIGIAGLCIADRVAPQLATATCKCKSFTFRQASGF